MFASLRRRLDDLFNPVHMLEADVQPPPSQFSHPNIVIVAQTNLVGPLFPSANACAVAEPIKDAKAAVSMKPLPMLKVAMLGSIEVALSESPITARTLLLISQRRECRGTYTAGEPRNEQLH